jgi:DinB superfamily
VVYGQDRAIEMAFLSFAFRKTDRTMPMLTHPNERMEWSPEARAALGLERAEPISSRQLASLVDQVQSVTHRAKQIVVCRSRADLTTRLKPSSWSVAECFDHLALTTRAFLPAISDALATASNLTTNRPLGTGILARLLILNLEPPSAVRFNVLPQLRPQRQDFDAAWGGFLESQSHLLNALSAAGGLAIDKVKIESPVYARIRYTVYGAFRMLTAHERRHLWQITQVLRTLDQKPTLKTAI